MNAYYPIGDPRPGDSTPPPIDRSNPFERPGEWLRCALHTHSTVSDGTVAPHHLVQAYSDHGFDVVAITDHWRLAEVPSTDQVLTIPGAELGWDIAHPRYPRQSAEFLVYGIDHIPDDPGGDRDNWYTNVDENYEVRTFPDLTAGVRWAETMGAVVYVAHPYWTELSIDDLLGQDGFAGIEVFNGATELATGRGDASVWWDALLGRGRRVFGIATDDQHYPLSDLGTGWTMVRVAERTQAAVLDALRHGHTYFSHGPQIHHVHESDGAVEVECSPAVRVLLQGEEELGSVVAGGRTGFRQGRVLAEDGRGLVTRVRFDAAAAPSRYRRVTVVDSAGRRAWTNPL
jgi:hypothetical protein